MNISIDNLKNYSLSQLEELYAQETNLFVPDNGAFKGIYLKRIDNPGANKITTVVLQKLSFDILPFGLNFYDGYGDWFFFHSFVATAKFISKIERSRWRNTNSISLNYETSKLPGLIKDILYDEIKPISENIFLGIGGLNYEKDKGDHFFFAIEKMQKIVSTIPDS